MSDSGLNTIEDFAESEDTEWDMNNPKGLGSTRGCHLF